jgi:hypothetical protein
VHVNTRPHNRLATPSAPCTCQVQAAAPCLLLSSGALHNTWVLSCACYSLSASPRYEYRGAPFGNAKTLLKLLYPASRRGGRTQGDQVPYVRASRYACHASAMKQLPVATKRSARMCVALPEIAANDVRVTRLGAPRRQRPVFENLHIPW